MTKKIMPEPLRYNGWINYTRQNGGIGAVGLGFVGQDDTVNELTYMAHYYADLGYEITEVVLYGVCPDCDGERGQRNKRSRKWHDCKTCNGQGTLWELQLVPTAVLALPDPGPRWK